MSKPTLADVQELRQLAVTLRDAEAWPEDHSICLTWPDLLGLCNALLDLDAAAKANIEGCDCRDECSCAYEREQVLLAALLSEKPYVCGRPCGYVSCPECNNE